MTSVEKPNYYQTLRNKIDTFASKTVEEQKKEYQELLANVTKTGGTVNEVITLGELLLIRHNTLNGILGQQPEHSQEQRIIFSAIIDLTREEQFFLNPKNFPNLPPRMLNGGGIHWRGEVAQLLARTYQRMGQHAKAVEIIDHELLNMSGEGSEVHQKLKEARKADQRITLQDYLKTHRQVDNDAAAEVGKESAKAILEMRKAESYLRDPELAQEQGQTAVGIMLQALLHTQSINAVQPNRDRLENVSKNAVEKAVKDRRGVIYQRVRLLLTGGLQVGKIELEKAVEKRKAANKK